MLITLAQKSSTSGTFGKTPNMLEVIAQYGAGLVMVVIIILNARRDNSEEHQKKRKKRLTILIASLGVIMLVYGIWQDDKKESKQRQASNSLQSQYDTLKSQYDTL